VYSAPYLDQGEDARALNGITYAISIVPTARVKNQKSTIDANFIKEPYLA